MQCIFPSPYNSNRHLQLNKIAESWISGFTKVEGLGQREAAEHKDYCVRATNCASAPSWPGNFWTWFPGWLVAPVGLLVALANELVTCCKTGAHSLDSPVDPLDGAAMPAETVLLESW